MEQNIAQKIDNHIDLFRFRLHTAAGLIVSAVTALPFDILTAATYAVYEGVTSFRDAMVSTGADIRYQWASIKRGW